MKIEYTMPGIVHTFKKGHRIMVQIQSTWFPLVARNPQKFVDNYMLATQADFQKATEKVFFGSKKRFDDRFADCQQIAIFGF